MNDISCFKYFSLNGIIKPIKKAIISFNNIEYCYGYGVYESLKVRKGVLYFVDQHAERLLHSAIVIGLEHKFTKTYIKKKIIELVQKLEQDSYNIKLLLIGGNEPSFTILPLAPLYPNRKFYKKGVSLIVEKYERKYPTAKTLNMLGSYIAYKKAKEAGCYDALLIDNKGIVLEGTRTNLCFVKGKKIYHVPLSRMLLGVTLMTLKPIAISLGLEFVEKEFSVNSIAKFDGGFLTSTSSKILPIRKIGQVEYPEIHSSIKGLMRSYNDYLATYGS